MSYYRPAKVEELTEWLEANHGYMFEGYDILDRNRAIEELAAALVDTYDVVGHFKTP